MKRVLSLVLALVLVFGTILPAFADETATMPTAGDKLYDYGVIKGNAAGEKDLNLNGTLTRAEMMVILSRLYGEEEQAKAFDVLPKFTDVQDKNAWYTKYVAYGANKGWTKGFEDNTFRPMAPVSAQQVNLFLLRVLGVDPEWAMVNEKAQEWKIAVVAADAEKVVRKEIFESMLATVNATPDGENETLGTKLALPNYTAPVPPTPEKFEVADIKVLNTKQIEVKFNQKVDKASAETAANYTVKVGTGSAAVYGNAKLLEDEMTVVCTMAGETAVPNASKATFVVKKAVKNADDKGLEADYKKEMDVVDTTSPVFESVKAVGSRTLELTFSEPVYDGENDNNLDFSQFLVKSGIYTYVVTDAQSDYANHTVKLTLGTKLLEGDITVKYNAQGMSNANAIRDFAGLVVVPATVTYNFKTDSSVPTVELTSVNKETKEAKVMFSKPVYGTDVKLYHSVNGVAAYATSAVTVSESNAKKEWTFTFTNKLPSGKLTFFLVNDTSASKQISDLFGVKVPNQTFTYDVVADTTAPTVTKVKVNANTSIDVEFSENVPSNEIKTANFEILKPDGKKLSFSVSKKDDKTVRLNASLTDNATYTVTVKAMKDAAGNAMAAEYTENVTVGDNGNPTAEAYMTDNKTLYIKYNEDMNQEQIGNKNNYAIDYNGNGTFASLTDDDTLTVMNAKKVKIELQNAVSTSSDVNIGAVTDTAGKKLQSDSTFVTKLDVTNSTLEFEAELVAKNKVLLKFTKELGAFDAADFVLADNDGAVWLSVESNTVVDAKSQVTLVLDKKLASNKANLRVTTAADNTNFKTKSLEGTKVNVNLNKTADNKIAPTVESIAFASAEKIVVTFDKDIDHNYAAANGTNGFSVEGGTLTKAVLATPTSDGKVFILTGTDFTIDSDVSYAGSIKGKQGNKVAAFTHADQLVNIVVTFPATADSTATLSVEGFEETFTAGNKDLIDGDSAASAQTIGDFTFVLTPASGATIDDGADQVNVAIDTAGKITVTVTDANDTLVGDHTITVTNITTGAATTITVSIDATPAAVLK